LGYTADERVPLSIRYSRPPLPFFITLGCTVLAACGGSEFQVDDSEFRVDDSGGEIGSGGGAGNGGEAGRAGSGAGGSGNTGGELGSGAMAGAPGGAGAAGAPGVRDAGSDSGSFVDAGCATPTKWYPDGDEDDYGRNTGSVLSCHAPPGSWATMGGDCNDDNALVHPGQADFFGEAYETPTGGLSFDYDCSGQESGDENQPGLAPNCGILVLADCSGQGFAPTERTGAGVNPSCGATAMRACAPVNGLFCSQVDIEPSDDPKRCH
jgi:hypothetical protein